MDKTVESVTRGISLLDADRPGWENEIDLETLDITDGLVCILGQLYGDFFNGLCQLRIPFGGGCFYGFNSQIAVSDGELEQAWKNEIEKRRNAT